MRPAERPDLLTDYRLITVALVVALLCAAPFAAAGWLAARGQGVIATLAALVLVAANGAGSAWLSARGGHTASGIRVSWVVAAVPLRLAVLVAAIAALIGPLGLPANPVVLAVFVAEICVINAQAWTWTRGPSFIGPLTEGRPSR